MINLKTARFSPVEDLSLFFRNTNRLPVPTGWVGIKVWREVPASMTITPLRGKYIEKIHHIKTCFNILPAFLLDHLANPGAWFSRNAGSLPVQ